MAIGFAGNSVVFNASSGASGSGSITVPAGTTSILLFSTFWRNGTFNLTSVSIGGASATIKTNTNTSSALNHAGVSVIDNYTAGSGSKTLAWTWSGAPTEGGLFTVVFLTGADTTGAVRNSGGTAWSGSSSSSVNVTTGTNDIVLGQVESYTSTNPNGTPSGSDQTILHGIDNSLVNSDKVDLVQEGTVTAGTETISGVGYYGCIAAASIIESTGASTGITATNMVGSPGRLAGNGGGLAG